MVSASTQVKKPRSVSPKNGVRTALLPAATFGQALMDRDFSSAVAVAAVHERSAQLNIITHTHNAYANMKILQAIGLGVAIIVLKLLMGPTFSAFESTMRVFFLFVQEVLQRLMHASIFGGGTSGAIF